MTMTIINPLFIVYRVYEYVKIIVYKVYITTELMVTLSVDIKRDKESANIGNLSLP